MVIVIGWIGELLIEKGKFGREIGCDRGRGRKLRVFVDFVKFKKFIGFLGWDINKLVIEYKYVECRGGLGLAI